MKKLLANLFLVCVSLLIAALLAEGGLRIVGYSNPLLYRPDPCCGASLRPGAEGLWNKEGKDYVVINSQGLRDREHTLEKPAGVLRIAVLGDSYAEAFQLPMDQAFWSVLERGLASCGSLERKTVEVINFGVSGYSTAQELLTLRNKVWNYDPDLVVLAFLTGNDIRNNHRSLEGDPIKPYFLLEDGQLHLDDSYVSDPGYLMRSGSSTKLLVEIVSHSRLLQLLNEARQMIRADAQQQAAADQAIKQGATTAEMELDNMIYQPPESHDWQEAWAVTEALVQTMDREVKARGTLFLLVTLSNGVQVIPADKDRENFRKKFGVKDLFYPDRRLAMMAVNQSIQHLTLAPKLLDWAVRNNTCVHGFENASLCGGHWNRYGHEIAGKFIAKKVCSMFTKLFFSDLK